ncbi:MAG: aminotransferase IV, partial [Arenibacter sp.]|nr:aminotransferase IV [Arenibacter sp.]
MNKIYPPKVYLNGDILAPDKAKISVFDRGFLFGDGIYEVMAQIGGDFLYREAHIDRLQEGLQKINIEFDVKRLETEIPRLLQAAELQGRDCLLYIQITRGVAPRKHAYPIQIKPTVMMYATAQT